MAEKNPKENSVQEFLPEIRRGRFQRLTIFEISESELEILEAESPGSVYLNFAIGLLSVAISLSISLVSSTIASNKVFIVFVIVCVVSYIAGFLLLWLWYRYYKSISRVADQIRKRLPIEGTSEPLN